LTEIGLVKVKFRRIPGNDDISLPKYQTAGSCAFDLHAAVKGEVTLRQAEIQLIPTGFQMELPLGFVAEITPRSGLALKKGISIVNSPGLIDSDYRGEVGIIMVNLGSEDFVVRRNDRIAQMSIRRYEHAEIEESNELSETERSAGAYGSTGR
jgi:dUTP pyrophosphatase